MTAKDYFHGLLYRIQNILNKKPVGLYLIGSASMNDYVMGKSDFDVVGVVTKSLTKDEKDKLAYSLDHKNFPCPAEGLDIVLMTVHNVQETKQAPEYEFWYSTGAKWPVIKWESGANSEMLIFLELCRQHGKVIQGQQPTILISPIETKYLYGSFKELIEWHRTYALDEYHDPGGQNSVLNACRILKFIETKKLYTKTEGGRLYLQDNPNNIAVQSALAIRGKGKTDKIDREGIMALLKKAEDMLNKVLYP